MGDRRAKKRHPNVSRRTAADPFAELGLNAAEFDVQSGGGKSFLSKQRVIWMTVTHVRSGRKVSGKVGTTKKGVDGQHTILLRCLLRNFSG